MNDSFEINSNSPAPPKPPRKGPPRKYPFDRLEPNDSVTFESDEGFRKARTAANMYSKKHGVKFATRSFVWVVDNELVKAETGGTLWRIA